MASFDFTVELERALLHVFTTNILMARMYIHRVNEDVFTSNERKFIYTLANQTLKDSKALLTHTVFGYEVDSRVSENDRTYYISEWNIIAQITAGEPPEALIKKLQDAIVGRKTLSLAQDVVIHLEAGDIEKAVTCLKHGAMQIGTRQDVRPLIELTDYQRRLQTIRDKIANPRKYLGMKTGFPTFDNNTGGLFKGELTLVAGITGLGKSTWCKQLEYGIITHPDNDRKNILHVANEEYLEQVEHKFDALLTGIPYLDFKLAKVGQQGHEEDLKLWEKVMDHDMKQPNRGRIFLKEVPAFTDVTLIEQAYRELENQGIIIDVIIIDHLPHIKPIQPAWGENDERAKAASDCKELARWLHTAVVIPTQAATEVEEKQSKGKRAGRLDVYGSKGQIHVANTFMIITYKGTDETQSSLPEYQRDVYWLCDVKKNRDGAAFFFKAKHYVRMGRVVEVSDDGNINSTGISKETVAAIDELIKECDSEVQILTKANEEVEPTDKQVPPVNTSGDTVGVKFNPTFLKKA